MEALEYIGGVIIDMPPLDNPSESTVSKSCWKAICDFIGSCFKK